MNITISEETFKRLQALSEALIDTPDTVIIRLLDLREGPQQQSERKELPLAISKRKRKNKSRAKKGEVTGIDELSKYLVSVLKKKGGEASSKEVLEGVFALAQTSLKPLDFEYLPSGDLRWRSTCRFARNKLTMDGRMERNTPRGIWKLAEGGRGDNKSHTS